MVGLTPDPRRLVQAGNDWRGNGAERKEGKKEKLKK
jgi:hypothetical protein